MQTSKPMTLLIDWGNSAIKYLFVESWSDYPCQQVNIEDPKMLPARLAEVNSKLASVEEISQLIGCLKDQQQASIHFEQAYIASVNSQQNNQELEKALLDIAIPSLFIQSTANYKQLRNAYQQADKLGVDRWLAMIAGYHLAQNQAFGVIDLGSAVTLDIVDAKGQHLGGHILPGEAQLVKSLQQMQQIPTESQLNHRKLLELGKNTQECVNFGCQSMLYGYLQASISVFQAKYQLNQWFITGGGASNWLQHGLIQPQDRISASLTYIPELVFCGLWHLVRENEQK